MGQKAKGPKETAAERAYADIGSERAELAQQMRPVRNDLFKRVADFRQRGQQMRNLSAADMALAKQPVLQAARSAGAGSALPRLGLASSSADQASATERRMGSAHAAALGGLAGMAVNDQGAAIEGMGQLAQTAQNEAIRRARKDASNAALRSDTIGAGLGAAAALAAPMGAKSGSEAQYGLGGKDGALIGTADDPYGLGAVQYR